MSRLLSRFEADGSLAQASPALIKMSIEAAREEARNLEVLLGRLEPEIDDTQRDDRGALLDIVAKLAGMLDAYARALHALDVGANSPMPEPENP